MKPLLEVKGKARVSDGIAAVLPESRHEIWHRHPDGDIDGFQFDLPMPTRQELVGKAALETWKLGYEWYSAKQNEPIYRNGKLMGFGKDMYPTCEPTIHGPFPIPEFNSLDMARFYILCRWKRRSPLIVSVEEAELYATTEYPDDADMYGEYFMNLRNLGQDPAMEREARRNAQDIPQALKRDAEFKERLDYLATHRDHPLVRGA